MTHETPNHAPTPPPDEVYAEFDDLRIVGRELPDDDALTLTAVMRNEMYYLPSFFDHYRSLGVERFVILDDQSTDGSLDFMTSQPDCMVLNSDRSFNEPVNIHPHYIPKGYDHHRLRNIWSNLLVRRYAMNRWSLHLDADEFLRIPEGKRIQDLLPVLDSQDKLAVWCIMLELYPATIKELYAQVDQEHLDPNGSWYYDACKHQRFRKDGRIRNVYGGSRARLMHQFEIRVPNKTSSINPLKALRSRFKQRSYNLIKKAALMKMCPDGFLYNSHQPSFDCIKGIILPLEHFKFNGQLIARTQTAIERGSHFNHSVQYKDMDRLLEVMRERNASFLTGCSSSERSFEKYRRCGIAQGAGIFD